MRLNLDEEAPVVMRRRLVRLDGYPVAFCDSYYPAELVEGTAIADNENIDGAVHALIEDPAGRSVVSLLGRSMTWWRGCRRRTT